MPDNKGIPEGKKRYTVTLTEETMVRMKAYIRKNNAPPSLISTMIDELLLDVLKTFDELEAAQQRQGGKLGIADLFSTIGKIMTDKEDKQAKLL